MKRRKAFVREEREIQIINNAVAVYGLMSSACITASQVANWLDIGATQARKLLRGLEKQGVLTSTEMPYPGVCGKAVLFTFSMEYIQDVEGKRFRVGKPAKRSIRINSAQSSYEVSL